MTENEAKEVVKKLRNKAELFKNSGFAVDGIVKSFEDSANAIEMLSEEIQQCREYKEIFENHFSEEALKLLSDKEEFGKWLERGRWIAKKCDEINRELEQYRAIGLTPELIEAMQGHNVALINDLGEYQAIGTVEEFKDLKEKNEPKKPRFYAHNYYCTECGNLVGNNEFEWQRFLYCSKCGQKIDWE